MPRRRSGQPKAAPAARPLIRPRDLGVIALSLALITLVVYAPAWNFGFLTFDDPDYITSNAQVSGGLTGAGLVWALTAFHAGTWMPVTWLSYMIDVALHGADAGWFHITNVALHVVSTLVLFGVLVRLTGAMGRSAFVAALFAVHPLHVESVAWIAERKDVLSTLFWWLAIGAYAAYVRRPSRSRYALVAACFAAGLMAKPMLVTLPLTLLLLDVWPLERLNAVRGWGALIREKLPLVALSVLSTAVTFAAQQQVGAMAELDALPIGPRLGNGLISYVEYLIKMIWPARLAILYPFPTEVSWLAALASFGVLAGITYLALQARRRHPYVTVGWFWYLLTLLPVIGVAQVGSHAMADRFTYVPLVGIFIVIAWGIPDLLSRRRTQSSGLTVARRWTLASAAVAIIFALATVARVQTGYWQDSLTCWQHALDVTADNFVAEDALGGVLTDEGRMPEAIPHFRRALELHSGFPGARHNLAVALTKQGEDLAGVGRLDDAIATFREALQQTPSSADVHEDLGLVLFAAGRVDDAVAAYREALRLNPGLAEAHDSLGMAYLAQHNVAEATLEFKEALRLDPQIAEAQHALAGLHAVGR
jgi:Flp pilus assembly protein TadD